MLRIEISDELITVELWNATRGEKHARTYPATDANKALLQGVIAARKARQSRPRPISPARNPSLFTYPGQIDHITPDRDLQHHHEIYLLRPSRHYRIVDGVYYPENTPAQVIDILENARRNGRLLRLRIYYGDTTTGECWSDGDHEGDGGIESGYVGNTTGWLTSPLLCHNRRSSGGSIISSNRIIRIEYANKNDGGVLYQNPRFHFNSEGVDHA